MDRYVIYRQGGLFHLSPAVEWKETNKLYRLKTDVVESARYAWISEHLVKHLVPNMSIRVQQLLRELWQEAECA